METAPNEDLATQGRELVENLFRLAVARLLERGIILRYTPAVVETLLADWDGLSPDPLRALDKSWQQRIGDQIEDVMIAGLASAGSAIWISVSDLTPKAIVFEIESESLN